MGIFDGVEEFAAVAECGSFTEAGRRLGLSKSAVSARVMGLEERLGVRLLHRTTRALTLTEAGRAYHEHCAGLVSTAGTANEAARAAGGQVAGRLRISCTVDFAVDHIAPLLPRFQEHYPEVVPDLVLTDTYTDLIQEGIDVAVRYGPLDQPSMVVRILGPLWGFACASPAYLERAGAPERPEDLVNHRCLLFSPYPWGERWPFVNAQGEQVEVTVPVRGRCDSGVALRSALVAGAGISLLATPLCGGAMMRGELVDALPGWLPDTRDAEERFVYLAFPTNRHMPGKVRAFADFLAEALGRPPYWDQGLRPHA